MSMMSVLSTVALLLLVTWVPGYISGKPPSTCPLPSQGYYFNLTVYNSLSNVHNVTYLSPAANGGSLFGAMTRLSECNKTFTFTTTPNADYGPYLLSVNGVKAVNHNYWEVLVKRNGSISIADVGVGCLIPNQGDQIILKYTSL